MSPAFCRHDGQPSQDVDVEQWLPLVWWVVNRVPWYVKQRLPEEDRYQAGVVGLLNARRCWRPGKGASFKTYAASKIRWSILIAAGLTRKGWAPMPVQMSDGIEGRLTG